MKHVFWAGVFLAGCGSTSGSYNPTDEEREIQRQFEAWRDTVIRMDIPKIWEGMSVGMKSEWLYQRINDPKDPDIAAKRRELKGQPDQELEIWRLENLQARNQRPTALPSTILQHPWLYKTFRFYYEPVKEYRKREFEHLEVIQVAADSGGASVTVKNKGLGGTDLYVMVWEGTWKIDHHKEPGPYSPK